MSDIQRHEFHACLIHSDRNPTHVWYTATGIHRLIYSERNPIYVWYTATGIPSTSDIQWQESHLIYSNRNPTHVWYTATGIPSDIQRQESHLCLICIDRNPIVWYTATGIPSPTETHYLRGSESFVKKKRNRPQLWKQSHCDKVYSNRLNNQHIPHNRNYRIFFE